MRSWGYLRCWSDLPSQFSMGAPVLMISPLHTVSWLLPPRSLLAGMVLAELSSLLPGM